MIAENRSASSRSASFARLSSAVRLCTRTSSSSRGLRTAFPARLHTVITGAAALPVSGSWMTLLCLFIDSSGRLEREGLGVEPPTFHHNGHVSDEQTCKTQQKKFRVALDLSVTPGRRLNSANTCRSC